MQKRITYVFGMIAVLFIVLSVRTAYLQMWEGSKSGEALAAKALKYRTQVIPGEEYFRGEILDRNLISITDSQVKLTLVAFPLSINSITETAAKLENIILYSAEHIETLIKRGQETFGSRTPVIIKTNLTALEVERLQGLVGKGIAVVPIKIRYGPDSLARHLVGYLNKIDETKWQQLLEKNKTVDTNPNLPTSYKITDEIGVTGLEGKYEDVLKGSKTQNSIVGITDANGQLLQGLGYKMQEDSTDPWRNHLVLTLDRRYQEITERVMDEYIHRGAVVVLDITSGDVLAAASRPNFDQNKIEMYLRGKDELIDRTTRVAFYPGSVFKMVVAAGVLEEGLVTTEEKFNCSGSYSFVDGTMIGCLREHGEVNMEDAISKSCNTTFVKLGLRLGNTKFSEYATKLGFTVNVNSMSPPALVGNASIGQQGVLVSPMQIANLYATLARDGQYQPWRILKEIRNYKGDIIYEYPSKPSIQAISTQTCEILNKALINATKNGSGQSGWIEEVGAAGKTGTAQTNDTDKVIAWFAGFTPLDSPRIAIAVMVEENANGSVIGLRGGETAGPIFKEIAQEILKIEKE
jgi:penicillin-binding protein 2